MAAYLLVGLCIVIAFFALWKGDPLVGIACLAASVLVYWATLDHFRLDWFR